MLGQRVFLASASVLPPSADDSRQSAAGDRYLTEAPGLIRHMSGREAEILRTLLCGYSNKMIARELNISEATVKVHLKTVLRKLNVRNRTQAAMWAMANNFSGKKSASISLSVPNHSKAS
jgi:two-component system, NarL family, nitrate/nitrite response regulator NarL